MIQNANSGRVFQIGTVFRAVGTVQGVPKHITQADFDIVGPDAVSPCSDAEIVSFQLALMDMFPVLGEARLQLGHVALTSAVLDICHVPSEVRSTLLGFVKEIRPSSGAQFDLVRQFLSRYASSVNASLLISIVSHRGMPADSIVHLRNHFIHNRSALNALGKQILLWCLSSFKRWLWVEQTSCKA